MRDAVELLLPDPCLVVLVGAAGSGKSTFAARWFTPVEVLSSDAFRELVSGDRADQRATRPAFAALHAALGRRLAARVLTVVDATSVTPFARAALLRQAAAADLPAVAIVLDLPADVVLARNLARSGRAVVPEPAVRRQLGDLARSLAGGALAGEGFAATWTIRSAAGLDRVVVRRVARGAGDGRSLAPGDPP